MNVFYEKINKVYCLKKTKEEFMEECIVETIDFETLSTD
jgi:hypothetical protein